jgi:16S rRNA (guanine1207-N2)-methyltransferase
MSRLIAAIEGGLELHSGPALALRPAIAADLSPLGEVQVVHGFKPAFDHFAAQYDTRTDPEGAFAVALVTATRSKEQTRGLIAEAAARAPLVLVDGQKTDGIESILRDMKRRATVGHVTSKAHGKLFSVTGGDFSDWRAAPRQVDGFHTVPGVFSADGVDPGSALLAQALPDKLPGRMADFGAGWGYLARACLQKPGLRTLYLVEAEHVALDSAKVNVEDPRAQFLWADATTVALPEPLDAVVMNPPFHQDGRKALPDLGRAFIASAARCLGGHGRLWCVANRHLPYEAEARRLFAQVDEIGGDSRFKLILAQKPRRSGR